MLGSLGVGARLLQNFLQNRAVYTADWFIVSFQTINLGYWL
jgi:hypothetical protein